MALELLLASNSPRRRELLALTGWPFAVCPVDIDESPLPGEHPADYVSRLAREKATAAGQTAQAGQIILAADTTVADDRAILGKPGSAGEARAMLRSLRGREHTVYTAIGVLEAESGQLVTDLCQTAVKMRSYTDEEIEAYIASGDPFDKAGAYAIQHPGFHPVESIRGCYACVVGLPVCHVVRAARQFGLEPESDLSSACPDQLKMDTPCPVLESILRANGGSGQQ
jgi:septum formation protein